MRQVHLAGDKLFVDYSGKKAHVVDAPSGEATDAEVFGAARRPTHGGSLDAGRTPHRGAASRREPLRLVRLQRLAARDGSRRGVQRRLALVAVSYPEDATPNRLCAPFPRVVRLCTEGRYFEHDAW
jgi:hypothetical protein